MTLHLDAAVDPMLDLRTRGDAIALVTEDAQITYHQLADRVDACADTMGTTRRLVHLRGDNGIGLVVAYLAARAAGHVVLLTPPTRRGGRDPWIDHYDPDLAIEAKGDEVHFDERRIGTRHSLHPDLALLMSTSGSTGSPKLVRQSSANLTSNAAAIADYLRLTPADCGVLSLPLHYCYGLSILNSHLAVGASVAVTNLSIVDECFWTLVERRGVTGLAGVPHTFDLLDATGFAERTLPRLRYVTQAGGRLPPERVTGYVDLGQRHGWDFVVMYGQTEATSRIAYLPPALARHHPGAIGRAIPGGRMWVEPCEPGSDCGELMYSGPNVMLGYAAEPADLSLGGQVDILRTGDLAREVAPGIFQIVGRLSRHAKIFGLRIDLDSVETHLGEAGITAMCVASESAMHVLVSDAGRADQARAVAMTHCDLPGWVVQVTVGDLPRTPSGKPDHAAALRHAEAAAPGDETTGDGRVTDLCELYARLLGREDVAPTDSFRALGADSLSYVELAVRLGERIDPLPPDWHRRTIADLAAGPEPRRRVRIGVDTTVLLRAAAILAVVGTHANLFTLVGGAHCLLAVAGYNMARFLPAEDSQVPARLLRSVRAVALPSMLWIGGVALVTGMYDPATALLLNGMLGSDTWTVQWQFWFLEAWVWIVLVLAALSCVPRLRRLDRARPFAGALVLVTAGTVLRYSIVGVQAGPTERYTPALVFWVFALGWAASRARTTRERVLVSVLAVLSVAGYFGDPAREALVGGAVLLMVWVPVVRVSRPTAAVAGSLATASLSIYLTHWQIYPWWEDDAPLLAVALSVSVGLAYHWCTTSGLARLTRRVSRDSPLPAGAP